MQATDQELVEFVVKALVNQPEAVKVERRTDEMGVLITVDVAPEDMGMVIGREGATAKAIRTLLRVVGAKQGARVNMKISEPEGSAKRHQPATHSYPTGHETPQSPMDEVRAEAEEQIN